MGWLTIWVTMSKHLQMFYIKLNGIINCKRLPYIVTINLPFNSFMIQGNFILSENIFKLHSTLRPMILKEILSQANIQQRQGVF